MTAWLIGRPAVGASPFVVLLVDPAVDASLLLVIFSGSWLVKLVICRICVLLVLFFVSSGGNVHVTSIQSSALLFPRDHRAVWTTLSSLCP